MLFDWQGAWASVIHHPLFGIGITLGAYQLVLAAFEKTRWIFLQPVLVSMLLVIGVLVVGAGLYKLPPLPLLAGVITGLVAQVLVATGKQR